MGVSPYIEELREKLGHDLLLLPGVAALVWDADGRLLLQRRADDGRWELPAGAVDPGETPAEAIVRETREETGMLVSPEQVAAVFGGRDFRHTYPNGDQVEPTTIVFHCTIRGGQLRKQEDETTALRFFLPEEVAALLPRYPAELFTRHPGRAAFFASVRSTAG